MRTDLYTTKLIVVVPLLVGCSACSRDLTRAKAVALLQATPECSKPMTLELSLGGIAYVGTNMQPYKAMEQAGYFKITGPSNGRDYYTYTVLLTARGEGAARKYGWTSGPKKTTGCAFRATCPPPEPQTLSIPVATCRISEVTGIIQQGNNATVDFVQTAEPNEFMKSIAKELGASDATTKQSGRREFILYDDGWRIVAK